VVFDNFRHARAGETMQRLRTRMLIALLRFVKCEADRSHDFLGKRDQIVLCTTDPDDGFSFIDI